MFSPLVSSLNQGGRTSIHSSLLLDSSAAAASAEGLLDARSRFAALSASVASSDGDSGGPKSKTGTAADGLLAEVEASLTVSDDELDTLLTTRAGMVDLLRCLLARCFDPLPFALLPSV